MSAAAAASGGSGNGGGGRALAVGSYRWEQTERSWEDLQEDADGQLHDAAAAAHYKRQRLEYASRSAKRRMVRYVVLVLDLSVGLSDHDLRPNRFTVFRSLVEQLIDTFFDQNPVSQLGAPASGAVACEHQVRLTRACALTCVRAPSTPTRVCRRGRDTEQARDAGLPGGRVALAAQEEPGEVLVR